MLKVIGAGLGRTGTTSLKLALEKLLGGPCYHMDEVLSHPEHISLWHAAAQGKGVDWSTIFDGYIATVDWPSSAFWFELSSIYTDSLVILSYRDADSWWESARSTIFRYTEESSGEWRVMADELFSNRFTSAITNRSACIAAFNQHNERVRKSNLGNRLLEWQPSEGWEPLCRSLGLAIPEEPFPHLNSMQDFVQEFGTDS
ncbi:hypothetical protein C1752_13902 [Acaryochloris thomasi RCC1774]|uniref:Sulfotransferase family protein n=1 Tax=Acaryochloris thomasi RCC1774 TaxID=1764569 RepID=A0A2W1JN86_9CYAN|nr:sulfotransferase family protein [Acaryochloris thomasi]PZD70367.1 hypothetical protein C1752_13902 [Acaryochloris thomasi RCC1774]